MSKTMKPRAEHMTKGELVVEFRKLQKWYNTMRISVNELEEKYDIKQKAYNEAVNLNLTMTNRVQNQERLLINEITSNNEKNQTLYKQIEEYQKALHKLNKENSDLWHKSL